MRVFVTGATGFIGSAIVQELLKAGHQVLGLARSDASAKALADAGGEVFRGNLEDTDSLRKAAAAADGVIHTAFIHDFSTFEASANIDRQAIATIIDVLKGTNKPLVTTSGMLGLSPGKVATEDTDAAGSGVTSTRLATEALVLEAAAKGVRSSIIRLPPSVHGDGDHGFVPFIIAMARQHEVSPYIGDGQNRWPSVHRLDAANLFRLALEKGAAGSRFHGIGDTGIPTKEIATVIGQQLNVPVKSFTPEEAAPHFTWMSYLFALDAPATCEKTTAQLGWKPTHVGLIEDLEKGTYFKG